MAKITYFQKDGCLYTEDKDFFLDSIECSELELSELRMSKYARTNGLCGEEFECFFSLHMLEKWLDEANFNSITILKDNKPLIKYVKS